MDKPWRHYTKGKKLDAEDHLLFGYTYIKCPEEVHLTEIERPLVVALAYRDLVNDS